MLQLKNIKKDYPAGDGMVKALKGINLSFRESEFVSILGPSGCGKTTMLNIIGGLDHYTDGNLIINGRSTKDFNDRDWDTYRNHSIGFVFQSYNLIPHQTVLQNVELALTLSGIGKAERKRRAKEALNRVGLGNQLNKRPGEMSGGQMQRVAIARAIVNDPDIILADEPTGALDTETSIQVMDLLKEISKDKLIIMVTHNPELAQKYSTRIISMLDGAVTGDTSPFEGNKVNLTLNKTNQYKNPQNSATKNSRKPSMSFVTAFSLSLKNLFTKKGRTILTSFAGSIGIIGIALIFAVSHGTAAYINTVQEDTLSSYPITIESSYIDMGQILQNFIGAAKSHKGHDMDAVYSNPVLYDMLNSLNGIEETENDLKAFKKYLEQVKKENNSDNGLNNALTGIQYTYDIALQIYTKSSDGEIYRSDSKRLLQDLIDEYFHMDAGPIMDMGKKYAMKSGGMIPLAGTSMRLWQEMLPGENGAAINPIIKKQYDLVYGSWPDAYNEIVLVLDKKNEIDDMALYALGLKAKSEIDEMMKAATEKDKVGSKAQKWTYEEICNMEFKTVLNSDCYVPDAKSGKYIDLRKTDTGRKYLYDNGIPIKVTGIIKPSEDSVSAMITGSIGYTHKLTEYVIKQSSASEAVKAQQENKTTDIFTGLPFKDESGLLTDEQKKAEFQKYVSRLDEAKKVKTYIKIMSIPSDEQVNSYVQRRIGSMSRKDMEESLKQSLSQQMKVDETYVKEYVETMSDDELKDMLWKITAEQYNREYAVDVEKRMRAESAAQLAARLNKAMQSYTLEQYAKYYDKVLNFSESNYEDNLKSLGCVGLDDPATINLYAASFESKDIIEKAILDYNKTVDEISQISYTDYIGVMMASVTTVINAITYVLIAFVAVSLIVSSIMIGVITLISVQERTKEIGILRAIGASKLNVSSMFNAETVIIGFASGAIGIIITYLLCIPINLIMHAVTDIPNLNAYLPMPIAIALIIISMLLTLISGIIPSRSAAKKDPVEALRIE